MQAYAYRWLLVLALIAAGFCLVILPKGAHAQMLNQCVSGMHVIDGAGVSGVVTGGDNGMCYLRLDKGGTGMRSLYALSPAPQGRSSFSTSLPSGAYDCSTSAGSSFNHPGIMAMGYIDISGGTYRMRPYGRVTQGFAPYAISSDGSIRWGGRMGGLDTAPARLLDSRKTSASSFNVRYRIRPDAYIETMSCRHL